jgi:hypothetical protein
MVRRAKHTPDALAVSLERVRRHFDGTPLSVIGSQLIASVAPGEPPIQPQVSAEDAAAIASSLNGFLDLVPRGDTARFRFDAGMIDAIANEWADNGIQLSSMILPKPANEWGHQSIPLPAFRGTNTHVVNLVLIPRGSTIDQIDLLDYPFLMHELGHNVLFKYESVFIPRFERQLDVHLGQLARLAIPDRGAAKTKSREIIDEIRHLWTPTHNHFNWALELAVDIIALWTSGPAYLAAFHDVIDAEHIHPYHIAVGHPPYEVRSRALIRAAQRIGWHSHTNEIDAAIAAWRRSTWKHNRTNRYLSLAADTLVDACVETALLTCNILKLPKCTPEIVATIQHGLLAGELPELGSRLIVASWLCWTQGDQHLYDAWERQAIRDHLAAITL